MKSNKHLPNLEQCIQDQSLKYFSLHPLKPLLFQIGLSTPSPSHVVMDSNYFRTNEKHNLYFAHFSYSFIVAYECFSILKASLRPISLNYNKLQYNGIQQQVMGKLKRLRTGESDNWRINIRTSLDGSECLEKYNECGVQNPP
jgi:hypothetical protein